MPVVHERGSHVRGAVAVTALTPEHEHVLAAPGARVTVAAGAGTGKTTLLVEAIWRDIERDGVPVERIFAATFNRAAAAHLAARLQDRFADPDDGRGAARAALDVSAGWIGTFHALAARMAREHPFDAGVDPDFTELDEVEAAALMDEALGEALAAVEHPGLSELLASQTSLRFVRETIATLHASLRAAGHREPALNVGPPRTDQVELHGRLEDALASVASHADARPHHDPGIQAVRLLLDADLHVGGNPPKIHRAATGALKPLVEQANDLAADYCSALAERDGHRQVVGFAELFAEVGRRYELRKRALGALDFADLEFSALEVLRAGRFAGRFDRAYADEFQDANAIQNDLLEALGAERTTVVGDGAQAIYGFRHANSDHFMTLAKATPDLRLGTNYRSSPGVLDALNRWLAAVLEGDPAFRPLSPGAGQGARGERVELRTVPRAAGRVGEAEVLADTVVELRGEGFAPREIAVLFRALTDVEIYRAAIAARGIPLHLVAGRGFFAHEQVADALAMLRVVENPHDEPALVRMLASPYVGASDEALVALRREAGERGALWPAVERVADLAPAIELVARLRGVRRAAGLAGLVEAVAEAADYDLAILGLPDGARRMANLRRLTRMAASFSDVRGDDLRGFLDRLAQMDDDRQDPGEATIVDPSLDAVRLMTVHGAKGQEFPAVVLADAGRAIPVSSDLVVADSDGTCGAKLRAPTGGHTQILGYERIRDERVRAEAAEERRVLYVAMTRAKERLIVIGRPRAKTAHDVLAEALTASAAAGPGAVAIDHRMISAPPDERPPPPAPPQPERVAEPAVPAPPAAGATIGRLSFSALGAHARCARRFHLEYELGMRGPPEDAIAVPRVGRSGPWGATGLGSVVHAALEVHAWGGPPTGPGWAGALGERLGLPPSPADATRAEHLVAALLADPLAARVAGGRPRPEVPFALNLDDVVLNGSIDLWVEEPDGSALVVDWKSHDLAGADPAGEMDHYALQRTLYGLVALEAGHPAVELRWVFLDDLARPQIRRVTGVEAEGLRDELRAALAGLRSPPRPPASSTPQWFCSGCPGLQAFCPVAESVATAAGAARA